MQNIIDLLKAAVAEDKAIELTASQLETLEASGVVCVDYSGNFLFMENTGDMIQYIIIS